MFTIVEASDIPVRVREGRNRGGAPKYPWGEMNVGQGFFLRVEDAPRRDGTFPTAQELHIRMSNNSASWVARNDPSRKFRVRSEGRNHPHGVWVIREA